MPVCVRRWEQGNPRMEMQIPVRSLDVMKTEVNMIRIIIEINIGICNTDQLWGSEVVLFPELVNTEGL